MEQTPQTSTQQPAAKVKSGAVVATIWTNEGQNGPFHTITLSRSYKDRDDNWQRTSNLRPKDMPDVQTVAGLVTEKIAELTSEPENPGTEAAPETQPKKTASPRKAKKAA